LIELVQALFYVDDTADERMLEPQRYEGDSKDVYEDESGGGGVVVGS